MGRHVVSARGMVKRAEDEVLTKWRSTNEIITATINFAIITGRLENRREKKEEREERDNSDNE